MKIGSFLVILLAALVALGFMLSDSFHLREDISNQQEEIERLSRAVQQAEQEKQNALIALQTANQEKQDALTDLQSANQNLQSCQKDVEQSKQTITRITEENTYLKEQNQVLVSQQSSTTSKAIFQSQAPVAQSTVYSLIALVVLGVGSLTVAGLKGLQVRRRSKQSGQGKGHYVFLSEAEIEHLVQRRRKA